LSDAGQLAISIGAIELKPRFLFFFESEKKKQTGEFRNKS